MQIIMGDREMMLQIALLIQVTVGEPLPSKEPSFPHVQEVKNYADVIALSQVVMRYCNIVGANVTLLQKIGKDLHFDAPSDTDSLNSEAVKQRKEFETEMMSAPSVEAWCDHQYSLFGPTGTTIPGLLRQAK